MSPCILGNPSRWNLRVCLVNLSGFRDSSTFSLLCRHFFNFIFGEWILVVKVLRWCVSPLHMHCRGKLQTKKKNANGEMVVCLRMSTLLSVLVFFFCACFSVLLLPCATANPTQLAFRSQQQEMCHLTLVRHVLKRRKQMFSDFKRHFVFVPFESTNCLYT